jgi:DNA gyrase subunit B
MDNNKKTQEYTADQIQVLEGLEAVRRRPGMYIGGTDQSAAPHGQRSRGQLDRRGDAGAL